MTSRTTSLIAALAANLVLAGLFLRALLYPADFTGFIYRTGLMIFMIEFMSLHSSGMFFGAAQQEQKAGKIVMTTKVKITMLSFYVVMITVFAAMTNQWLAAAYFVASLGGKAAYSRSINIEERLAPVAAGITMLLLSTFVIIFSAGLLQKLFPFPPEVLAAKPPGQSGLFIDTPQTLMAWGVLYFGLMTLCEILIFRRSLRKSGRVAVSGELSSRSANA